MDTRPELLDLYCCAGGAGMGYHRAGFNVTGVDIKPQPHYPFKFIQADALEYVAKYGWMYDAIHSSPPCQDYSVTKSLHDNVYPDLVAPTRAALKATGKPYVIENVAGAPLIEPLILCGTMFGLRVIRHRLFEISPRLYFPPAPCNHVYKTAKRGEFDRGQGGYITVAGHNFEVEFARAAMGIDWMTQAELAQSIPPAFTQYVGEHLIRVVRGESDPQLKQLSMFNP